jgi:carboxypeptidase T
MKAKILRYFLATLILLIGFLPSFFVSTVSAQLTYHSYDTLVADLTQLANSHPNIAKIYNLGATVQGRQILAIKITDNAASDADEHESRILFIGGHHAREWISVEVPYLLAQYLVEHYNEPNIKSLVDNEEIWIIPLLNPDGFEYSRTNDRLWRKNRRHFPRPLWFDCYGVDLNRNYGASTWGTINNSANSHRCDDETYIGPNAFSETETQAIRNFFQAHRVDAVLSYHSYSQLILWPWGYTEDPISDAADRQFMENLGKEMRDLIKSVHNEAYIPQQSSHLYRTAGDLTDWSYETYGIPSFTIELRPKTAFPGFLLPSDQIDETFEENLPAALRLLEAYRLAIEYPTSFSPINAGSYANPHKIFIGVSGVGKGRTVTDFIVKVGGRAATVVSAVRTGVNKYVLGIKPPTQPTNGLYDLEVIVGGSSANQINAINYTETSNCDVVLVIDRSGSMGYSGYLEPAKTAAKQFVDFMRNGDKIGVVSFDDYSYINFLLTTIVEDAFPIFEDDMESGGGNWIAGPGWTITSEKAHSPIHAWSDSPGGNYNNNTNTALTLATSFVLTGVANPVLSFWTWIDLETGYDYGYVEVSTNGTTWTQLAAYTGHSHNWEQKFVDLSAYSGQAIIVRFRLVTDYSITYDGWYIDDVQIGQSDTKQAAKSAIEAITEGGMTSIGAGLQTAQSQLVNRGDPLHPWAIILLSDGYENTAPWVADVLPSIASSKTVVHTIALGPDSDQVLLQNIASQTGGTYSYAPDANALASIYNTIIGQVTGQQTLFSTTGTIQPGQTDEEDITIDAGLYEVTFSITWSDPNVNIDLTLRQPNGNIIDPTVAASDPNIDFGSGSIFEYYRVRNPMAGTWTMRISRISTLQNVVEASSAQSYTALVTGNSDTTLNFYPDLDTYRIGDRILLTAVLADQQPILGASLNVVATIPAAQMTPITQKEEWVRVGRDTMPLHSLSIQSTTITQTLTLYDDGLHSDGAADDGVYANIFTNTLTAGIYKFDLSASGTSNAGMPFMRLASVTVNVSVPPTPKVKVTSSPPANAEPGEVLHMKFEVKNMGAQWDIFDLRVGEIETILEWADTSSIPSTVSLYPGQSVSYDVIVSVPEYAPRGSLFTLYIVVTSQTDINISDIATIEVNVPFYQIYLPIISKEAP